MTPREIIFGKIRASLGVAADDDARRRTVEERTGQHPRGIVPGRGQRPLPARIALLRHYLEGQSASVMETAELQQVPELVSNWLKEHNQPSRLSLGSEAAFADLDWGLLQLEQGPPRPDSPTGLSMAFGGVAETGTLVLVSGAANPTTLNFMPENHIVVIRANDIAASYEDLWDRLRALSADGSLPRTVNYVSGPSRTGDIEQTILLGAHGPRRLHVIIVK